MWGKQLSTNYLIQQRVKRRERFTHEVDFDDFLMPFSKNLQKKVAQVHEGTVWKGQEASEPPR